MTATQPAPTAPAPQSPERTLATVASDGVSFLVYWLVILLLLGQAVTSVLRPPDGVVAVGLVAGLVCLAWATFCLTMGVLRRKRDHKVWYVMAIRESNATGNDGNPDHLQLDLALYEPPPELPDAAPATEWELKEP